MAKKKKSKRVKKGEYYEISENTLKMIDESIKNFKEGRVGKPIDLSEFRAFL